MEQNKETTEDHGLYAPHSMTNNLQYIITLPKATDIMVAQSGSSIGGYTLVEQRQHNHAVFVPL